MLHTAPSSSSEPAAHGPTSRSSATLAAAATPAAAAVQAATAPLHCLVLTASDSRTIETDHGGAYAVRALDGAGHRTVDRRVVTDDVAAIRAQVLEAVERHPLDVLVVTGGTSLALRDVTPEALVPLFRKQLPGFGEALRRLAFERLGPKAVLTRAAAGVIARTLVILLPGKPEVVQLAMDALVVPILGEACAQIRN